MHGAKGGLKSPDECAWCPAGASCSGMGLSARSLGGCAAGFLCSLGSEDDKGKGNKCRIQAACPAGHYCKANAARATPCPKGTWSKEGGLDRKDKCQWCRAGQSGVRLTFIWTVRNV